MNTFWLLGEKAWEMSLFTTYRNANRKTGRDLQTERIDDTPLNDLLMAPFRSENMRAPWVAVAVALGAAAAAVSSRNAEFRYDDIDRVHALGIDANQEWGTAVYTVDAFALSMGAAVGEEAVWRGMFQNELEKIYGARRGLVTTALAFGAAHIFDLQGDFEPGRVVIPTLGGFYLGYVYQRGDYRLGPPIAAHFWYNFSAMLTAFALDPDDNPLSVSVSFDF